MMSDASLGMSVINKSQMLQEDFSRHHQQQQQQQQQPYQPLEASEVEMLENQ